MDIIPCENCVVFAICINKPVSDILNCDLTFEFFCETAIKMLKPGTHEVILPIPCFESRNLQVRIWNLCTTSDHRYVEVSPYYSGHVVYSQSVKLKIRREKTDG
jgi:hypothetical protein